ncbi:AAA family ATPase [Sphingomonas sp. NFR15]|uniref:AAA family ATPase n=1 Tax=Sphingomonas sp. NFR15 TaxID=1566282 RepID=UPI000885B409|nr:AAA family ATPase [Sphingomonas sp. NFR15]SDA14732.1 Predicted ATPase [Sphingomonas sp. NFR15]
MSISGRLESIEFSRYRAFNKAQTLELRPLTLLFGLNSAGKSAALRLLPILAGAAQRRQMGPRATILDYKSPALRDARFQDLSNRKGALVLTFKLNWGGISYEFDIASLGELGECMSSFKILTRDSGFEGTILDTKIKSSYDVRSGGNATKWDFRGLAPARCDDPDDHLVLFQLNHQLDLFGNSVHWLGAVRATVPRFYELLPGMDARVQSDGSGVAEVLRLSFEAKDGAAEAVSAWLMKTCQSELTFAKTDGAVAFNRQLYPFNLLGASGMHVAVRDVGEGIAQALPVVTLCHQAMLGQLGVAPILAFEQPELHLHPAATVHLADEIISCVEQGSKASHVIETHSESMLLALQIAIVEKRLKPEDAIVYWVTSGPEGSDLRPIRFDEEGFPHGGWPQGVFREAVDQARRLSKLRISAH